MASQLPAAPTWLLGCHGTLSSSGIATLREQGTEPPSLRTIALARRTVGAQRMAALTDLPSLNRRLIEPNSSNGARPVGSEAGTDVSVVTADPWASDETLASYLDRRLNQAHFVYLPNRGLGYAAAKRLLDLVGAAVLLLVAAPVMVVLALLIRLDSPARRCSGSSGSPAAGSCSPSTSSAPCGSTPPTASRSCTTSAG